MDLAAVDWYIPFTKNPITVRGKNVAYSDNYVYNVAKMSFIMQLALHFLCYALLNLFINNKSVFLLSCNI